jgi:23S rRNA (uracil1939-C5)-methyltransferase
VIFVSGALPGEKVVAERVFSRAKFEEAAVVEVLKPAENRIVPKCEVFGVCGGCSFQHLSSEDQIEAKGEWLKDPLTKITFSSKCAMPRPSCESDSISNS